MILHDGIFTHRFLSLMKKAGVDFWAITTGNEPLNGNIFKPFIQFMSLGWTSRLQVRISIRLPLFGHI